MNYHESNKGREFSSSILPLCSVLPLCTILMYYTTPGGARGERIIHKEYNESDDPMPTCLSHWIKGAMYNDLMNSRLVIGMHLNRNKGVFYFTFNLTRNQFFSSL